MCPPRCAPSVKLTRVCLGRATTRASIFLEKVEGRCLVIQGIVNGMSGWAVLRLFARRVSFLRLYNVSDSFNQTSLTPLKEWKDAGRERTMALFFSESHGSLPPEKRP